MLEEHWFARAPARCRCERSASGTEASSTHSFRGHSNAVCPAARPPATYAPATGQLLELCTLARVVAKGTILYHLVQFARICGLVERSTPEPHAPLATRHSRRPPHSHSRGSHTAPRQRRLQRREREEAIRKPGGQTGTEERTGSGALELEKPAGPVARCDHVVLHYIKRPSNACIKI